MDGVKNEKGAGQAAVLRKIPRLLCTHQTIARHWGVVDQYLASYSSTRLRPHLSQARVLCHRWAQLSLLEAILPVLGVICENTNPKESERFVDA
jgi:hypothetical protein